jgi:hypothetical protein
MHKGDAGAAGHRAFCFDACPSLEVRDIQDLRHRILKCGQHLSHLAGVLDAGVNKRDVSERDICTKFIANVLARNPPPAAGGARLEQDRKQYGERGV